MNAEAFDTGILRVAEILRCTNVRQIKGALSRWMDGKVVGKCAMGVISGEYEARESRIGDHIVSLNDGNGYDFPAIADYLETTFIPE